MIHYDQLQRALLHDNLELLGTDSTLSMSTETMKFKKRDSFGTSVRVNVIRLHLLALSRATYMRKFRKDEMTSCRIFFFISSGSILGPSPCNLSILKTISDDFTLKADRDSRLQKHGGPETSDDNTGNTSPEGGGRTATTEGQTERITDGRSKIQNP